MSPPCSLGKIHGNRNGKVIANMPLDNLASGLSHSSQLPLTPRERQVLQALAMGKSNKMIARKLGITEGTVKVHVKNLLHKLGLRSRVEAAVWVLENEAKG